MKYSLDEIQEFWYRCNKAEKIACIINCLIEDECYTKEKAANDLMEYLEYAELHELWIVKPAP
jgi:hypothetical protein